MSEPHKPDSTEDRLLDHRYDDIQEYDNPLPRWWVGLFWATILFSGLYVLNVIPGVGIGPGRIANYEKVMKDAQAKAAALAAKSPHIELTEDLVFGYLRDPAAIAAGKQTFVNTCSPCHRLDAGGSIGPNLTDDYWLHGNRPMEIVHTITTGVPDKGMPTWGTVLTPEQIGHVAAFVLSIHGTAPPQPKAPQGEKLEEAKPGATGTTGAGTTGAIRPEATTASTR